jgi:photosystem II stability/assembly factor-like uncharacterized protein
LERVIDDAIRSEADDSGAVLAVDAGGLVYASPRVQRTGAALARARGETPASEPLPEQVRVAFVDTPRLYQAVASRYGAQLNQEELEVRILRLLVSTGQAIGLDAMIKKFDAGLLFIDERDDVTDALIEGLEKGTMPTEFSGSGNPISFATVDPRAVLRSLPGSREQLKADAQGLKSRILGSIAKIGEAYGLTGVFEVNAVVGARVIDISGAVVDELSKGVAPNPPARRETTPMIVVDRSLFDGFRAEAEMSRSILVTGDGWRPEGPYGGNVSSLAWSPADPGRLYAAGEDAGLWRSDDEGESWRLLGTLGTAVVEGAGRGRQRIHQMVVSPHDADVLWALVMPLARRCVSHDGGHTWRCSDSTGLFTLANLAWAPSDPGSTYSSVDGGLVDGRGNSLATTQFHVLALAVHPREAGKVLAGGGSGADERPYIGWTDDHGRTWRSAALGADKGFVEEVLIDPWEGTTLLSAVQHFREPGPDGGDMFDLARQRVPGAPYFYKSTDSAQSWERLAIRAEGLHFDPTSRRVVWAHEPQDGRLKKSSDNGSTWQNIESFQSDVLDLAFSTRGTGAVFAATEPPGGIYSSRDGGATWSRSDRGLAAHSVDSLVVGPDGHLVARLVGPAKFLRRAPSGAWQQVTAPNESMIVVAAGGGALLRRTDGHGLDRSTDGGRSWSRVLETGGMLTRTREVADHLVSDPRESGVVFLAAEDGLRRSLDFGATWKSLEAAPADPRSVAMDGSGRAFLAHGRGISMSEDRGDSWSLLEGSWAENPPVALTVHDGRLWAASGPFGIWSRPLP